jgi:polysaccharide transporter, PST family
MRQQAVRGFLWRLVDAVGGQTISFIAFLILARLLRPDDYGVVTLAAAIVAILSVPLNEGLSTALVQRDMITDDHINSAFWTNLGLSFFFSPWCKLERVGRRKLLVWHSSSRLYDACRFG